ncbi:hypothetical protein [Staphylococcus nepalensis]|uniref:hypothetical protein n=1 Tax=Staphylococcus nepalensis TaxID=214473 RepID=UPI000DFDB10F|nr:hypothetical protein [Staphylococcus nepalensis]SUM69842.1 Uncharacterised protein [Staphylococcus nepalensis]SUM96074.1 Uncharacterised protein [Staphylococcus nepalensis]
MAYEYERIIKKELEYTDLSNAEDQAEMLKELQEVYRKAKAWEELKELLMEEYPEVAHLADISNGDFEGGLMVNHEEIGKHMDKLDGTNEFSNLLSDLEDE